jgi:glycosyltransferase involved in cell wall biosynthesis
MNIKLAKEIKVMGDFGLAPKVSVFLLTYNHSRFINESLRSILEQKTEFPIEILVYDDCSTDDTFEKILNTEIPSNICLRMFRADENLYQKNLLTFAAKQLIINESRSLYVAHLEGDDFFGDNLKLQKQYDFLQENPGVGFTFHDVVKISESGQLMGGLIPEQFKKNYSQEELQNFQFAYIHASSVFWRKSLEEWPPEIFCCTNNTDMLVPYVWSKSGRAIFLPEIQPNRYRQTNTGIWTSTDNARKMELKLQTSLLMISLHLRNRNTAAAKSVLAQRAIPHINNLFK